MIRQTRTARLRPLFHACWLLSGAALVTLWAVMPDCEGVLCMGAGTGTKAGTEARVGEVPLAARQVLGGGSRDPSTATADVAAAVTGDPESSWEPVEPADLGSDPTIARQSEPEPEDWQAGLTLEQSSTLPAELADLLAGGNGEFDDPQAQQLRRDAWEAEAAKAAERWAAVAATALTDPDDELRGEAIGAVAVQRNDQSVAVLLEVADFDPAPDNRLAALRTLWYSAADGLDADGAIREILEQASSDPDERTAALAEQALADLKALEESQQAD